MYIYTKCHTARDKTFFLRTTRVKIMINTLGLKLIIVVRL